MTVQHWEKSRWELKQGRDPETGADTEAMEEYCLQALLNTACSDCLLTPRIASPGVAPPTVSWALPHQSPIKKMKNCLSHSGTLLSHPFSPPPPFPLRGRSPTPTLEKYGTLHKSFCRGHANLLYSNDSSLDQVDIKVASTPIKTSVPCMVWGTKKKNLVAGLMKWDKHI